MENLNNIIRIGRIELTEEEALNLYQSKRLYLVNYKTIYQLHWSANLINSSGKNGRVYGTQIYHKPDKKACGFTRRGRFFAYTAKEVNDLMGYQLVIED